ncbi:6214_t:CDS:1, partial [Gigaspora rosea]
MSDCPDLPVSCAGLSQCCDRKYGNWLLGSKCTNTQFCDNSRFYASCSCGSYVKNPVALVAIIVAILVIL